MIEWYQLVGLNFLLVPVIAWLDFKILYGVLKVELGRDPSVWHFLPATFLELFCFNAGIFLGVHY